jgi:ribonuclease P protein subunit POP4
MFMLTPQNLIRHELIGLELTVVGSMNSCSIGLCGRVIDETRNTIIISQGESRKVIPKATACFRFTLPSGVKVDVDGIRIVGEPENRVKKRTEVRR